MAKKIRVKFIKNLDDPQRDIAVGFGKKLWKVTPPIGYDEDWDTGKFRKNTDYIVSSAASVMFSGPETYIFPADEEGTIIDWGELQGSYRGGLDHDEAIEGLIDFYSNRN